MKYWKYAMVTVLLWSGVSFGWQAEAAVGQGEESVRSAVLPTKHRENNITVWQEKKNLVEKKGNLTDFSELSKEELAEEAGKTLSATHVEPLSRDDMNVAGLTLGERKYPQTPVFVVDKVETHGHFKNYKGANDGYTTYAGPLYLTREAVTETEQERLGFTYGGDFFDLAKRLWHEKKAYQKQLEEHIVGIHLGSELFKTYRGIGVGNTRGEVLFVYGIPNAIWAGNDGQSLVLLYAAEGNGFGTNWLKTPQGQESRVDILQRYGSDDAWSNDKERRYLTFTLQDNAVKSIDYLTGLGWSRFALAPTDFVKFSVGELVKEDFTLMGMQLNTPFRGAPTFEWTARGTLFGHPFIRYRNFLVGYDQAQLISLLALEQRNAVTRRGVAVGDSQLLMRYLYGTPTETIELADSPWGQDLVAWTYTSPREPKQYLSFVGTKKDGFIRFITLTDRPLNKLAKLDKIEGGKTNL